MKPLKFGYSVAEACEAIGCKKTTLYKLIGAGRLDARKLGNKTILEGGSVEGLVEDLPAADIGRPAKDEPAITA